jgi:hypothetical protein
MEVFMPQKNGVSWRVVVLILITVSLFLGSGTAAAKNPDLSYWTKNLSESAGPGELGEPDSAPEIQVVGSTVHVMWLTQDLFSTSDHPWKIYYRRSLDNGQTLGAQAVDPFYRVPQHG